MNTCHRPEYQSLPPEPLLADNGVYLASESSFYRVLKKHHQQHHRGRMKPRRPVPAPTSFTATGPNQVWSWDIVRHEAPWKRAVMKEHCRWPVAAGQ